MLAAQLFKFSIFLSSFHKLCFFIRRFTGRCSIECENGGTVTNECSCVCGYGFEGDRCEMLKRRKHFSDRSCGIYDKTEGIISLRYVIITRLKMRNRYIFFFFFTKQFRFTILQWISRTTKRSCILPMAYTWKSKSSH